MDTRKQHDYHNTQRLAGKSHSAILLNIIVVVAFTALLIVTDFIGVVEPCNRNRLIHVVVAIATATIAAVSWFSRNSQNTSWVSIVGAIFVLICLEGIVISGMLSTHCPEADCYISEHPEHPAQPVRNLPVQNADVSWLITSEAGSYRVIGYTEGSINNDLWWHIQSKEDNRTGWVWSGAVSESGYCTDFTYQR